MHMADALISPAVGGVMWVTTAGIISYSAKKVRTELDESKIPLMGVLGAFIFAAQMINFTIPGTGSSGHLGGALILSVLLGPYAAFLTMASILIVQALFFADGGLLALGCNIFNMGFFACFIGYPLIYKRLAGEQPSQARLFGSLSLAAIISLQLGALGVVLETLASGISELPFSTFLLLMQPIHLAIGVVEGLITAAVVWFVWKEAPAILKTAAARQPLGAIPVKRVLAGLLAVALITAGGLSWFASANPDGLEWSIAKTTGEEELAATDDGIHGVIAQWQEKIAFLPDYNFKKSEQPAAAEANEAETSAWPAVDSGTSVAGIIGSIFTLLLAYGVGKGLQSLTTQQS